MAVVGSVGIYYCMALATVAIALLIHTAYLNGCSKVYGTTSNQSDSSHGHNLLVVGIMSHRAHFVRRDIIRNGLLKQQQKHTEMNVTVAWRFLVADKPCAVPEEDRQDVYECEPYSFVAPSADQHYFHQYRNDSVGKHFIPHGPVGFDFVACDNINVSALGLYDDGNDGFKGNLKVTLYETYTQKIILARVFLPFGARGSSVHGMHVYKGGESVILPKGFHGSVVLEGGSKQDPLLQTGDCRIDDGGGLLKYLPGYRYGYKQGVFPHLETHSDSLCDLIGPSFIYSFHGERYNVTERSKRYHDLQRRNMREEELIQIEQRKNNDLLFVDTVEYYRNLPRKLLNFYAWLSKYSSFDFAMKTDDDCFINTTAIANFLLTELPHSNPVWIGNFRSYFRVNLVGKWQDHKYKSLTYPPFPCGSGYLVSHGVASWIAHNMGVLKQYQGEDVSLGIWLAAIDPVRVHEGRFACTPDDGLPLSGLFTLPDQLPSQLKLLYDGD